MRTDFGSTSCRILRSGLAAFVIFSIAFAVMLNPSHAQAAKSASFVMDAKTGKVLHSRNGDELRFPASLTKMMTLYMVFDAMRQGKMTNKTRIRFSKYAAARPPSKIGIRAGGTISTKDAVLSLVTKSANDVASAVGEHIGGSEANFARMMTAKARQLGMTRTTFRNASGLPNVRQRTTARDMAKLGLALRQHFPRQFKLFQTRQFKFGKRRYRNHNRLLGRVAGVDGIKTGYTRASGYNLVTSAGVGNRRIVAVVMGGKSGRARNATMTKLVQKYLKRAKPMRRGKTLVASLAKVSTSKIYSRLASVKKETPVAKRKPDAIAKTLKASDFGQPVVAAIANPPIPKFRSEALGLIEVAMAKPEHALEIPQSASAELEDQIKDKLDRIEVDAIAVPADKPTSIDQLTTSSTKKSKNNWIIQIGAVPEKKAVRKIHADAIAATGGLLAKVKPHSEAVKKGGETLYRVRFAGFVSKDSAWGACGHLKKKKFLCIALEQ